MRTCPVCFSESTEFFAEVFDRNRGLREPKYQVYQCRECSFGWTEPQLREEELAAIYPSSYHGDTLSLLELFLKGQLQGTAPWRMETEKVRLVEAYCRKGALLDVGCAEGKFLWALDKKRWKTTGVELSDQTVQLVKGRVPGVEISTGSVYSEELRPESFDVVTLWHVLEHLPDTRRVLARVKELLRPGGIVVLSLPNLKSFQASFFRQYWYAFDEVPRHLYHFSPDSLMLLLEDAGFRFEDQRFFSRAVNFHCWKHSLRNWSQERFGAQWAYWLLKPFLFLMPPLEALRRRYGVMTLIARRSESEGFRRNAIE